MTKINYPPTPTTDQTDDYHGTLVPDPYRWLEDTDSPDTRSWIDAQNALTFGYLDGIPARDTLRGRLTELWDFARSSAPLKRGGRYFQLRNSGLQNQDVLFVMDTCTDAGRVLLDPNTLSKDGTVAVPVWSVSRDGRWLAYASSAAGSDWMTWRVRDVATGEDLPDVVMWSKFSGVAWRADGSGFFYNRFDAPADGEAFLGTNYHQKLFFHRLGDPQEQDALCYARPDHKDWGYGAEVTDDGRYLVLQVSQGTDTRNRVFYKDLQADGPMVELIAELEAGFHFVGNDGPLFYFRTDWHAPHGRLIAIDTARPDPNMWRELVPETGDVLDAVMLVHDEFIALYMHDAHHELMRFALDGRAIGAIMLPTYGSIGFSSSMFNLTGNREDDELFFGFSSYLYPLTIYRYDFNRGVSEVIFAPALQFDWDGYVTRQVFATGSDGTRVPMFLTHKRDMALDGENPTLLYGYGGFNISLVPGFTVDRLVWLEQGGVLAIANLRGGGEYGEAWHQAGMLHAKQNVFDDFIACAEWLIAAKITSTPKLAIMGGSNGGLLVSACMTQRPDLFGATLPCVAVTDMLRFHKFTIGWAWVSDYGSPEDADHFKTLFAYSPLHNLKPGLRYPATLVTTSDHDDRVVPGHSFKFTAGLQAAQAGDAPVLIRVQANAGHGFGKPTSVLIAEVADRFAFLVKALEMDGSGARRMA